MAKENTKKVNSFFRVFLAVGVAAVGVVAVSLFLSDLSWKSTDSVKPGDRIELISWHSNSTVIVVNPTGIGNYPYGSVCEIGPKGAIQIVATMPQQKGSENTLVKYIPGDPRKNIRQLDKTLTKFILECPPGTLFFTSKYWPQDRREEFIQHEQEQNFVKGILNSHK